MLFNSVNYRTNVISQTFYLSVEIVIPKGMPTNEKKMGRLKYNQLEQKLKEACVQNNLKSYAFFYHSYSSIHYVLFLLKDFFLLHLFF